MLLSILLIKLTFFPILCYALLHYLDFLHIIKCLVLSKSSPSGFARWSETKMETHTHISLYIIVQETYKLDVFRCFFILFFFGKLEFMLGQS